MSLVRMTLLAAACGLVVLASQGPARAQSVTGAGTIDVLDLSEGGGVPQGNLTIAAHINPRSGAAVGVVRIRIPGFAEATVDVQTVSVQGDIAVAGGPIRAGSSAFGDEDVELYLLIVDNGTPNHGGPDAAVAILTGPDSGDFIVAVAGFFAQFASPVNHGNYTVHP